MVVRTEQVCVSITVPTAAAPAGGYPVLVAAHGTGGSFTDHIRGGIAHDAAMGTAPAITIGIDLPEHGSRRGGSTRSPDHLVYNFTNPHAARDVFLQGAADLMGTIRFAHDATITNAGAPVTVDPTRIVLFGHSQGAQHAALMAGFEPDLAGVVLSEAGGDLTQSLLNKTQPFDIAHLVPFALLDADDHGNLRVGDMNPALALFQMYFERTDAVNTARSLAREVPTGAPGLHVFATYGLGDSYTPEPTLQAFGLAAGFTLVRPILTTEFMPTAADAPLTGNVTVGTSTFTVGMRQYAPPAGVDGHFVALQSTQGRADVTAFVQAIFAGTPPSIGM
jgi:pimeloyl-ACP methyl ester carboxylesterase